MTLKIGICGSNGRMGQVLAASIKAKGQNYQLTGNISKSTTDQEIKEICQTSNVIIDFSSPKALAKLLRAACESKINLVIGTTGIDDNQMKMMRNASNDIAILYAPNTSLGANLIAFLSAKSAKLLPNFDIEIVEAHHKYKQDAPSGGALMIGREIAAVKGSDLLEKANFNRYHSGQRKDGEIGFSSIRAGGIYGEHTVIIASDHEVVKIQHQALNREVFADGALAAADWIVDKEPGLYSMKDMLGLN